MDFITWRRGAAGGPPGRNIRKPSASAVGKRGRKIAVPGGVANNFSPVRKHWELCHLQSSSPFRGGIGICETLANPRGFEDRPHFFFKRISRVVLCLMRDVIDDSSCLRWAHTKGSITLLPLKETNPLPHQSTGIALECANGVRQSQIGWQIYECMNVVLRTANREHAHVVVSGDSGYVCPCRFK